MLKFLWTWGFDDLELGNSAAYIDLPKGRVLIDCWLTAYQKLKENNLINTIDYVILTHLHWDHMWSLFHLICKRMVLSRQGEWSLINLVYSNEIQKENLLILLKLRYSDNWKDFCNLINISEIESIDAIDITWFHFKWVQTFSFIIKTDNKILYFSWDLGEIKCTIKILNKYQKDDIIIFHEVGFSERLKWVHCYYKDLQEVTQWIETYCYHCDHTKKPNDCTLEFVADYPEFNI